jgi:hypothetical protein
MKAFATTMDHQPLFEQGIWLTPLFLAVGGIAAALCALYLV